MKFGIGLILFLIGFTSYANEYEKIRQVFYEVSREEISVDIYLGQLNELKHPDSPCSKAYIAMGEFFLARESWSPLKKYDQFLKGKKMLESAVKEEPNNHEIIFLRLCIQTALPPILKYNQNIEKDSKFLIEGYPNIEDKDLKEKVKILLTESNYCKIEDLINT